MLDTDVDILPLSLCVKNAFTLTYVTQVIANHAYDQVQINLLQRSETQTSGKLQPKLYELHKAEAYRHLGRRPGLVRDISSTLMATFTHEE